MAVPTKTKVWLYDLNNSTLADSTFSDGAFYSARARLLQIKDILIGFASNPWTVVSSSNSVTSGLFGAVGDLWDVPSDLVWRDDDTGGAVRSWIVLRQAAISTTFELLLICEENSVNNDGKQISAWVAQTGFTGGTTTSNPDATDSVQLRHSTNNGGWGGGAINVSSSSQTHAWMSTDGECTRIVVYIDSVVTGFWLFDKPTNPLSSWTDPYIATILGDTNITTTQMVYSKYYDAANLHGYSATLSREVTVYASAEGFVSAAAGETFSEPNQHDGTLGAAGMGLSSVSVGFRGRVGEVFDLYWGFTTMDDGACRFFPADGTKTWIQINDMVMPWDGSTFIKTE